MTSELWTLAIGVGFFVALGLVFFVRWWWTHETVDALKEIVAEMRRHRPPS